MMAPKGIQVLRHRTYEYVTCTIGGIKVANQLILREGDFPDYLGGPV